ncbi:MAG: hypothetical protein L0154_21045 [Chloroflexi bacterium]|nr:hypothetical protein [Chloroflexota bacterium]
MKLPGLEQAIVPEAKITEYLLNLEHEEGGAKAIFFIHFGFSMAQWKELARALLEHAHTHEVVKHEATRFGTRYVIEGTLQTPVQRTPWVRVVWFIAKDTATPRLTTAYPMEKPDND